MEKEPVWTSRRVGRRVYPIGRTIALPRRGVWAPLSWKGNAAVWPDRGVPPGWHERGNPNTKRLGALRSRLRAARVPRARVEDLLCALGWIPHKPANRQPDRQPGAKDFVSVQKGSAKNRQNKGDAPSRRTVNK